MENIKKTAFLNRHERRRRKALERKRDRQVRRQQSALPTALLASAAIGVLATANLDHAQAQVVLNPPGTIPAQCTVTGGTAVCEGDLSAGLDADGPPLTNLTVQNLTSLIAPAAGIEGIDFDIAGDGNATLTFSAPPFGLGTTDANGIDVLVGGSGNITINATGDITTQGASGHGIEADVTNDGNVFVQAQGRITSARNGIDAGVNGNGDVTIMSSATIISGSRGIYGAVSGNSNVFIQSDGSINSGIYGIKVEVEGDSTASVISNGTITSGFRGISARLNNNGSVTILSTGQINAHRDGIEAIVRGNGFVTVRSTAGINTTGDLGEGIRGVVRGTGSVIVHTTGPISTQGDQTEVIFGGVSNGDVSITAEGQVTTQGSSSHAVQGTVDHDGTVTINTTGSISTQGAFSSGVYGLARRDGTVVITTNGSIKTAGSDSDGIRAFNGGTGAITVTATANIVAPGSSADGIIVEARGSSTVNVVNSTVQGGSGNGVGVSFAGAGGSTNTLNTSGDVTLSSLAGTAISGGAGNTTIINYGTLNTVTNGAIELGGGSNAFNNRGGAIFNAGGIVNLGAGNLFSNSGTLSPGASGTVQTTAITGTLVQNGGGIFLVDVDPGTGTGDLVTVTETAALAGNVQAHVINPAFGDQSITILSAAGGTINNGLGLLASPALQASLSFPNANDVVLNYSIDFSAGGLNPNQTALANGLNAAANTGTRALDPVLLPLLNNVFTIGDYRNALNQMLPEVVLNTGTATLFASEGFVDNLFSCRLAGQNHTALSEGECYWARPQGRFLDRDSDANTIGFDETSGGLAAGAQVAVAPNWFAGFALGYERASLDTDTGAETDSNRFSGGLSLKYQAGSFLLGAAISGGVSGNDTQRPISFGGVGGFNATAESNYAIKTLTGQARAAYVFRFRDWFAKPLVDVTATYLSRDGVTETGAGAANLAIAGSDETFFSVTPALEIGGDFALSETSVIRPYVRAGVSFYTDSDHSLTASFVNAPAGTSAFSITSDFDDVFADVAAGATAFFDNGSTLGLSYEGLISSDTQQHGLSLKGTIAF